MSLYLPSMDEIHTVAQSRGEDSDAPNLWRGLVGAWPLQEGAGTRAWDVSGERNHGTHVNGPTHVVGRMGRALGFDGVGVEVAISDDAIYRFNVGDQITLHAWVNIKEFNSAYGGRGEIVGKSNDSSGFGLHVTHTSPTGRVRFGIRETPLGTSHFVQDTSPAVGVWIHYAGVYDGKQHQMLLYKNGRLISEKAAELATMEHSSAHMNIGGRGGVDGAQGRFVGKIGIVGIQNNALTPLEIQTLYRDPWAQYRVKRRDWVFGATLETIIDCTLGTVAIQGRGATVLQGTDISCSRGEVVAEGHNTDVQQGATIDCTLGSVAASPHNAAVHQGTTISTGTGAVAVTPHNAAVAQGTSILCGLGQAVLAAHRASVASTATVKCTAGSITLAGHPTVIDLRWPDVWTPDARGRTWTPKARERVWTPK